MELKFNVDVNTIIPESISFNYEELDEELDDVKKIRRKNYQPKREHDAEVFEEEDDREDLGETKQIKLRGESVKSKAKEILGDMFPFKED